MELNRQDIENLEQRYRAALINSITGFKSVSLIGTVNAQGDTNLAIFSSVVHLGAHPPLIGMVVRPDSAERHTLENILDTGYYTINHIRRDFYMKAHQTSARYPRNTSEFQACGLTELWEEGFMAPFVAESTVRIGLQFREKIDFHINGTIFIIGEILHLHFPIECWEKDGFVNLEKAGSITCSGLDSYHTTQKIGRLLYAKPNLPPGLKD